VDADVSLAIGDRGLRSYAIAFALTQIVEVPIYVIALSRSRPPGGVRRSFGSRVGIGFGASVITHPIVWFVMPAVSMWIYGAVVGAGGPGLGTLGRTLAYGGLAEGFAIVVEALYLRAFAVKHAVWWAAGANAASVVIGTALVWGLG